ncbi:hypothetical protein D3C87_1747170 [compost metagenome]
MILAELSLAFNAGDRRKMLAIFTRWSSSESFEVETADSIRQARYSSSDENPLLQYLHADTIGRFSG